MTTWNLSGFQLRTLGTAHRPATVVVFSPAIGLFAKPSLTQSSQLEQFAEEHCMVADPNLLPYRLLVMQNPGRTSRNYLEGIINSAVRIGVSTCVCGLIILSGPTAELHWTQPYSLF